MSSRIDRLTAESTMRREKRLSRLLLIPLAVAWISAQGAAPFASEHADQPMARTDANSLKAHEQLLAKRTRGKIDVYFMGDSITRRWGASDRQYGDLLSNWNENFK